VYRLFIIGGCICLLFKTLVAVSLMIKLVFYADSFDLCKTLKILESLLEFFVSAAVWTPFLDQPAFWHYHPLTHWTPYHLIWPALHKTTKSKIMLYVVVICNILLLLWDRYTLCLAVPVALCFCTVLLLSGDPSLLQLLLWSSACHNFCDKWCYFGSCTNQYFIRTLQRWCYYLLCLQQLYWIPASLKWRKIGVVKLVKVKNEIECKWNKSCSKCCTDCEIRFLLGKHCYLVYCVWWNITLLLHFHDNSHGHQLHAR